ncbi:MAG: TetR/AcrR family transcriptional regulator [Spirochaetes bacterium]|nr:TetR/AcrR family transcriptional regulator [Spirochaetota bacterium]
MEKERKDSLLRIGERLFALHGYRDVSIRDITEAAGLAMGSFYTYFPGKESFYAEILNRIEQRGIREVEKHVNSFHFPLNKLKALYRYTTLSLGSNEILRGIYRGEKRFLYPGLEARTAGRNTLFERIGAQIEAILSEGGRKGVFRTGLFHDPKRMLIAIFNSLLLDIGHQKSGEVLDDMLLLIERGLKRWLRLRKRDERLDWREQRKP